ncbi:MAG: site-specific integrase [Thermodesulfobacteriota bacterium]
MAKREKTKHKGIYRVGETYYITYYVGPKKYEKAIGSKLSEAVEEKTEREKKARSGKYAILDKQEKMTFKELFELYEKEGDAKDYILTRGETYLNFFGSRKLSQVTRTDLFSFKDMLKATPKQIGGGEVTDSHVNRVLAGLRRLFNFAVNREMMERSPFPTASKSGLFSPENKGLRNFFSEKEMETIVGVSPDWLRPLILTAYYTGTRENELLSLRWNEVDLQAGIIYLPSSKTLKDETGKGQRVVMQRELIDLFKSLPKGSEWVFSKPGGDRYYHWNIFKAFRSLLKSLDIDTKKYSWKELRHTTASLMHLKGVPALSIKDQLRHTTVKTTEDFYIGSNVEYQREQAEKLILNSGKLVGNRQAQGSPLLPSA